MGWSTELFCNISFNKKTYDSYDKVVSDIEDLKRYIRTIEDKIKNLAFITEPDKFYDKEKYDSPCCWIESETDVCLGLLRDYYQELNDLEHLKANWKNCHNKEGLAIDPPDNIKCNTAYLSGDFIKSVKYPAEKTYYGNV